MFSTQPPSQSRIFMGHLCIPIFSGNFLREGGCFWSVNYHLRKLKKGVVMKVDYSKKFPCGYYLNVWHAENATFCCLFYEIPFNIN
jgi:hypothetical protein